MTRFPKYFLVFLLLYTASLIYAQFNPKSRYAHASILIDSRLYFIGGFDSRGKSQSEFFYLDLSISFSTKDMDTVPLRYIQLNNVGLTPNAWCKTVTTNNMIYLFGCLMVSDSSNLVYQYSISSNEWTKLSTTGTSSPVHRIQNDIVVDNFTGNIYYFGGKNDTYVLLNDLWLFSTNNNQLNWRQMKSAPLPICCFSAILLPDGYILYIGGRSNDVYKDINPNNITRYNTKSDDWDFKETKGDMMLYRQGFSAVLVQEDGRIIVYGGMRKDFEDDLYVLDTTTYRWLKPEVKNKPPTKSYHTACKYENYMIVAFGILNDNKKPDSRIYLLDLTDKSTYRWVTDFKPNKSIGDGNRVNKIIAASIGAVIFSILVFFSYRFYKKRKSDNQRERPKIAVDDL